MNQNHYFSNSLVPRSEFQWKGKSDFLKYIEFDLLSVYLMETWNKWVKSILMAFLRPQRTCLPGNENCFFSTTT